MRPSQPISTERPHSKRDLKSIPPHCNESEVQVLGSLLVDPSRVPELQTLLTPEDFFHPLHTRLYALVLQLYEADEPITLSTVRAMTADDPTLVSKDGPDYIEELHQITVVPTGLLFHARRIREFATRRRLITLVEKLATDGYQPGADIGDLLSRLDEGVTNLRTPILDHQVLTPDQLAQALAAYIPGMGLLTGFPTLDRLTGGLEPEDFMIIAGRPSVGKTTFAVNVATYLAIRQGLPVLFISKEMSAVALGLKVLALVTGGSHTALKQEGIAVAGPAPLEMITRSGLHIESSAAMEIGTITAIAADCARRFGIKLIILDYLTLLEGQGDNRVQEVTSISGALKRLAKRLQIPVLCLAQLNRAVESRPNPRPRLSDLRESGAIEQDADKVGFLWRPEHGIGEQTDGLRLSLEKNRCGPTGDVELVHLQDRCLITEATGRSDDPHADLLATPPARRTK